MNKMLLYFMLQASNPDLETRAEEANIMFSSSKVTGQTKLATIEAFQHFFSPISWRRLGPLIVPVVIVIVLALSSFKKDF